LTTGSPITTAIREAHQMARRHLNTGGATTAARGLQAPEGFLVPSGIDTVALVKAIEAKLHAAGDAKSDRRGDLKLLERRPDGRIIVPRVVLAQLGTGDAVHGEQLVERLISEMRSRRIVMASRAARRANLV
jgi:hypothetical protein